MTARERDTWFLPSLLSWLGVGSPSDKGSVLVESCARDIAWYAYTTLRASEAAQPDMSLELWTELQAEMSVSHAVTAEQALAVRSRTCIVIYPCTCTLAFTVGCTNFSQWFLTYGHHAKFQKAVTDSDVFCSHYN